MAYERNGSYYRSRRVGRKVCTQYLGRGAVGQLAAEIDELEWTRRREEQQDWQRRVEADTRLDSDVKAVADVVRTLTDAALLCNDYHTHKGQWRKRRE